MKEGIVFVNKIKQLVDKLERNPHWLSKKANVTYRIVRNLYNEATIPPSTSIGTLFSIAQALGVAVDELYIAEDHLNNIERRPKKGAKPKKDQKRQLSKSI